MIDYIWIFRRKILNTLFFHFKLLLSINYFTLYMNFLMFGLIVHILLTKWKIGLVNCFKGMIFLKSTINDNNFCISSKWKKKNIT